MPTKYELNGLSTGELLEMVDRIAKKTEWGSCVLHLHQDETYSIDFNNVETAKTFPTLKEALIEAILSEKD